MLDSPNLQQDHLSQRPPEKEKPIFKSPIAGTNWLQVTTTEGNAFYWHKITKASTWKVPNELKSAFSGQHDFPALLPQSEPSKPTVDKSVPMLAMKAEVEAENDETQIGLFKEPQTLDQLEGKSHRQEENDNQENTDIPIEERTDLFKALLFEKNVNPFHPFDVSLPQFISDPRYHLLPSAARREAFDEYCRDKARDWRHTSSSEARQPIDSREEFENLLKDQVTSTRSSWTAFRKEWKKDRRFFGWGRDDREREKRFRDHLKELGGDNTQRNDRKIRAVKEREEKVKAERQKIQADVERHKLGASLQGAERSFVTLLTDAVRDPQVKWEQVLPHLKADPRFKTSLLPLNHRIRLFHDHLAQLHWRKMDSLHALFEANAPSLDTPFSALPLQTILSSSPIAKLSFDACRLEAEFQSWQQERFVVARKAFDDMLAENSFVDFWGRLRKMANDVDNHLKFEDDDIGGIEDEKVDMRALAKGIDLHDMAKVLKNDKRYNVFDHIPEQREQWLKDHLSNLTEAKHSVHISG